jgi:uncharacterized protein YoxC
MPLMLQVWIVIVTLGLLAIAMLALRAMTRMLGKAAQEVSQLSLTVRESAEQIDLVAREARELAAEVRECVVPVRRVVDRFEVIGQRAADVSSAILEEVEEPVYTAIAMARGARSGATRLLQRVMHRFTTSRSSNNGDQDHE